MQLSEALTSGSAAFGSSGLMLSSPAQVVYNSDCISQLYFCDNVGWENTGKENKP